MKLAEAVKIWMERKDLVGFLHMDDIQVIGTILKGNIKKNPVRWSNICNVAIKVYKAKEISNKDLEYENSYWY